MEAMTSPKFSKPLIRLKFESPLLGTNTIVEYAIVSAAYGNMVVTAGFHPWSHTVTNCCRQPVHLASSSFASHPAVDPVRADLSGCRACCVRASGGVEVACRALSSERRRRRSDWSERQKQVAPHSKNRRRCSHQFSRRLLQQDL